MALTASTILYRPAAGWDWSRRKSWWSAPDEPGV